MKRPVLIALVCILVLDAAIFGGYMLYLSAKQREEVVVPDRAAEAGTAPSRNEETIRILNERVCALEEENRKLKKTMENLSDPLASTEGRGGTGGPGGEASGEGLPVATPASSSGEPGARSDGEAWAALADRVARLLSLAKEAGDKPTPELMKTVSEMMQEVAELQGRLGLDDPGFVTESPAFQAHALARLLADTDEPLTEAERLALLDAAGFHQARYLEAARPKDGEFALDRMANVLDATQRFRSDMDGLIAPDRFAGIPFAKKGGGSGRAEDTSWPDQSSVSVKDLQEAADSIAKRWADKMSIPETERPTLQAVVRDFVERSRTSQLRAGAESGKPMSAEARRSLDREIALFEVEALRRIHDSLNLDEAAKKKVRDYRSLDRFEIGGSGSWSRSGSFGGFVINAGGSEEEETK